MRSKKKFPFSRFSASASSSSLFYEPGNPKKTSLCENEPAQSLLLALEDEFAVFCGRDDEFEILRVYTDIVAAAKTEKVQVMMYINETFANACKSVFGEQVLFLHSKFDSIWIRDYGPFFTFDGPTVGVTDAIYYGGLVRPNDNRIPVRIWFN